MSQAISLNQSTWASKLKAMGPGILMATAAVGGSHIVYPQLKLAVLTVGLYFSWSS
ncbi:Nramp family metal ion transporter [Streptococcus pneumoniae]|nr:Nramp family metal ion transporter [Streptococcus pneumoniae]